jgi:NAD(P)-dependent dehydrogenase (short-subunit alcohol dehydrogenase family)
VVCSRPELDPHLEKGAGHPHTNMSKAALNMLTLTSAGQLFQERVLVNAVDTGWVTDMAPGGVGAVAATHATHAGPPLDAVDGVRAADAHDTRRAHTLHPHATPARHARTTHPLVRDSVAPRTFERISPAGSESARPDFQPCE